MAIDEQRAHWVIERSGRARSRHPALPTFLGIGPGRSGTRWLCQCLGEHPQVYLHPGEVYFFVKSRPHSTWCNGVDWYEKLFAHHLQPSIRAWGEITPVYLFDRQADRAIHELIPEVKLICTLRDQSEWAWSCFRLFLAQHPDIFHTGFSFENFLIWSDIIHLGGFYLEHIRRYLEVFPREQMLILLYDDLQSRPTELLEETFDFLGVDQQFTPPSMRTRINTQPLRGVRSPIFERISRHLRSPGLPGGCRLADLVDRYNATTIPREEFLHRHRLTPAIRTRIAEMCEEHNRQLGEFLGRDLSHWNHPPRSTRTTPSANRRAKPVSPAPTSHDAEAETPVNGKVASWRSIEGGPLAGRQFHIADRLDWQQQILAGQLDAPLFEAMRQGGIEGKTVLDIGGHVGYHALCLAELVGPAGRVHTFEPNPANLERLRMNLRANEDLAGRITVHDTAVGRRQGTIDMNMSFSIEDGASSGSFIASADPPFDTIDYEQTGFEAVTVAITTLDALAEQFDRPPVAAMKIDVEGAEAHVLDGAADILRRHRPLLAIETHSAPALVAVLERLEEYHYRPDRLPQREDQTLLLRARYVPSQEQPSHASQHILADMLQTYSRLNRQQQREQVALQDTLATTQMQRDMLQEQYDLIRRRYERTLTGRCRRLVRWIRNHFRRSALPGRQESEASQAES